MILNEQKYSNKNRLYYHGSDTKTFDKKRFDLIFLTTDLFYALEYTTTFDVFVVTLRAPLNIFNARSKMDLHRLSGKITLNDGQIDILRNRDWFNTNIRKEIFETIKNLGYDGVFNFESYDFKPNDHPSIGIFDRNNVIIRALYGIDDLRKIKKFDIYCKEQISIQEDEAKELALIDSMNGDHIDFLEFKSRYDLSNDQKNLLYISSDRDEALAHLYRIYKENNRTEKLEEYIIRNRQRREEWSIF